MERIVLDRTARADEALADALSFTAAALPDVASPPGSPLNDAALADVVIAADAIVDADKVAAGHVARMVAHADGQCDGAILAAFGEALKAREYQGVAQRVADLKAILLARQHCAFEVGADGLQAAAKRARKDLKNAGLIKGRQRAAKAEAQAVSVTMDCAYYLKLAEQAARFEGKASLAILINDLIRAGCNK